MFIIVEICIWKFFDVRNFIIFNLENKFFLRYKQWFLKVKFLSKITPNIRSWSTLLIIVLLYSISNMLQLCFLQMCIKLHLSMESFAPEAWHQSSMSFRVFEKISFTLLLSLSFVKIMASSAYIECSMCLWTGSSRNRNDNAPRKNNKTAHSCTKFKSKQSVEKCLFC